MSVPKRLPKEIADARSLRASGIYYEPDEVNMRRGYAMIIGPEGTPYAFCPLFFILDMPPDYPFSSPAVKFITTDGMTRFHPNLYVGGKVCLSILGTWSGPSWAAVMTISTVLSSIQSLLEPNPIVNEPGWEKFTLECERARHYSEYVQHALISHSLRSLIRWKKGDIPAEMIPFQEILAEKATEMIEGLTGIIEVKAAADEVTYPSVVYNMQGSTHWKVLKKLAETYSHATQ
jgi:ubiquitin-conjugating enzyme E2 Z